MADFEKMYFCLFNHITDALELLGNLDCKKAEELLKSAQQEAEEIYISGEKSKAIIQIAAK